MKLSNPEKNKARLLKERLYKREYRKRMKDQPSQFRIQLMKGSAIGPHIRGQLGKLKSHFLEVQGRMLLCQVRQKSFSCAYHLIIHKVIDDDQERSWLIDFLDRQGITYTTPGKWDWVCMGKINGKKVYETKKYLLRMLNDLLDILNGCQVTGIQTEDSFMNEFERKLSFRQLYELIKANKQYIYNKNIPHSTC